MNRCFIAGLGVHTVLFVEFSVHGNFHFCHICSPSPISVQYPSFFGSALRMFAFFFALPIPLSMSCFPSHFLLFAVSPSQRHFLATPQQARKPTTTIHVANSVRSERAPSQAFWKKNTTFLACMFPLESHNCAVWPLKCRAVKSAVTKPIYDWAKCFY